MENENKNASAPAQKQNHSGNHKKNRPQKHKPYYIEPAGEQSTDAHKNAQAKKPQQKPEVKQDQPKSEGGNANNAHQNRNHHGRNHHNKNHKKSNPQNQTQNAEVKAPEQKNAPVAEERKAQNEHPAAKSHNRNRNRNRSHDKRRDDNKPEKASTETFADQLGSIDSFAPLQKQNDKLQRPAPQKMSKFADSPEYAQYSDYEEFSVAELYGDSKEEPVTVQNEDGTLSVVAPEAPEESKIEVVGIRFKSSGKTYYFAPGGVSLHVGSHAIVETARGLEYGEVAIANTLVNESETVPPLRPVIRKATDADVKHHEENKEKEDAAFRICNEKIIAHGLDMKLIDAQYTFDNTKLLFYFTSSGRVDFRELVKDLASVFRTRIELRQIGIRDEAKMVGGLGLCGRPLCCSLFLSDFGQVSIKMAKEQNLSLNSSKISGICGRLMCCLRYEHDTYEYEIKRTPPVDSLVRTVDGVGVVTEINPLAATIKVKLTASPDTPPKSYHRDDVTVLKKKENS